MYNVVLNIYDIFKYLLKYKNNYYFSDNNKETFKIFGEFLKKQNKKMWYRPKS